MIIQKDKGDGSILFPFPPFREKIEPSPLSPRIIFPQRFVHSVVAYG